MFEHFSKLCMNQSLMLASLAEVPLFELSKRKSFENFALGKELLNLVFYKDVLDKFDLLLH